MEGMEKRNPRKSPMGPGGAKNARRKNKNGMKIKEEKMNPVGPDPGGGPNLQDFGDGNSSVATPSKSLQDELLLNGSDIKVENPSTPQLLDKQECNLDMMPHPDHGHPDFHDCKTPMNPYCYPHYNNMPPNNNQPHPHPGEFGPPHHHGPPQMMGGYPPPNCPPQGQPPPQQTKQQPSTLEAQYMQQQSQIFVFSTKLANKAAEAVFQGQFPSIIAFHNTHPATRKFMEYQGSPNWQPPPPQPTVKMGKGNKGQSQQHNMIPAPPLNMPPDFNAQQGHPPPPPWNAHNQPLKQHPQGGYPNYYEGGPFCGSGMGQSPCPGPGPGDQMMGPGSSPLGPNGPGNGPPYFGGPGVDHLSSGRLTGVQIRDEDLTPEERARREAKLANLSTIGRMLLFPENDHNRPVDHNCHPHSQESLDGYNLPPGGPPPGSMEYMHGPNSKLPPNDWPGPGGGFYPDGQPIPGMKQGAPGPPLPPPGVGPNGNGSRKGGGGGSIPSPVTPLTPGSSCGGAPHRPSPHSPMSGDPLYPGSGGHSFYPSGYYSPQVGQVQDNSPSGTVQRKDSESSNSEGGKSRKEKSSCSISPTSSAPPSVKEANLMQVPSPQQIQSLNVFEGQELTIQKQPNVGLMDHTTDNSPGIPHGNQGQEMNPSTPLNQQKPSYSSPPTPSSNQKCAPDMSINSNSSSKPRPGSVGPIGTPKSSTTPNPSPQGMDRISQPGTPIQMNMTDLKNSNPNFGPPGHPGPGLQPPCNMMKQMPLSLDPSDGPNSGGVFDNVPLNPNLAGPGPPGNKPAFDPISSMVQMSQQLGGNGNSNIPQGSGMSGNVGYGMNPPGGPPMNPNMVNFNTSMHNIQNVDGGMALGGPQTVNNTYVSATMTIQQMNIQSMSPYTNPNPNNMNGPNNMSPMGHQMGPMGQQMGQHMAPIGGPGNMGPHMVGGGQPQNIPNHIGGPMGQMCSGPPMQGRGLPNPQMMYGNQQMPPRMGGQNVRSSPYRIPNNGGGGGGGPRAFAGANVQVKPNAPNTIQYLPARPPPPHNQGSMCSPPNVMGGGPMHGQQIRPGPNLEFLQRYTNPSPGPVVNVSMGMNVNVNMGGNRMNYPGPPQPGMGGNHGLCGPMGPMRGPPPPHMMDQEPGGPGNPGNGQPIPQGAMMGGGNMKGPGGYPQPNSNPGQPPPNDPAYAQQFHHFQQQLYATGSNNGRNSISMQSNVQLGNPNNPPNQTFFK